MNKTLRITPSVRAEYFSRQQAGALLPRLQLEQKFGKVSVKGAMGRYARGPDANAQGAATFEKLQIVTGGPDLGELDQILNYCVPNVVGIYFHLGE